MIVNKNSIQNHYLCSYSLQSVKIYLPIFQRGFSWKPDQTEKILEDIDFIVDNSLMGDKHLYLLDFIGFRENGCFKLADGQQRLVTLTILTRCLIECATENGIPYIIKNFNIEYDDESCQKAWEDFCNKKIVAPFKKVYLRLKSYINDRKSKLPDIEHVLMNDIYIYVKMTENADDAFDIFEQINTGGKPLTKDEIISTIIKQYSAKYGIDLKLSQKELKTVLTSYYKYSGKSSSTFNNLAIMSFLNSHVVNTKKQFQDFEGYIKATKTVGDLPVTYIAKQLNRTQLFDVIYAYEANGISLKTNRKPIDEVILPLFLLCAIFSLTGTNPGGRVKTFLDNILVKIKNKESEDNIKSEILSFADSNKDICTISLSDFTALLQGKSKEKILKALLLMDIVKSNTSGSFTPSLINLEHIYPQKPATDWSANGWPVNTDDQEEYIHNIGNYLILNESVNKKIQNEYITHKIKEYDRIIPVDKFLQTPSNTVDFNEFEKGKNYINERRSAIAKYIQSDFPCAKAFIK